MKFDISLIFENSVEKIQASLKLTRITGTLHEDQNTFLITCHSFLLRMRNISDKSCRENRNIHFMYKNFFFSKTVSFSDNVEKKYFSAGEATNDHMAHALSMLDKNGYKHTFRICNTYCSSTASVVTRELLNTIL